MANEKIKQNYKNIANAIRSKTGSNGLLTAEEMPGAIESIETGITPTGTINITSNGNNIDVAQYAKADVNVPIPPGYIIPSGTKGITSNGNDIDVTSYASVDVNVSSVPTIPDWQINARFNISYINMHNVAQLNITVENTLLYALGDNLIDTTTEQPVCSVSDSLDFILPIVLLDDMEISDDNTFDFSYFISSYNGEPYSSLTGKLVIKDIKGTTIKELRFSDIFTEYPES